MFERPARRKVLILALMMTVAAILELIGIGALIPVIGVMQQPELIHTNPSLAALSRLLGNPSHRGFFLWLLVLLVSLFSAKAAFSLLMNMAQYRFLATEHTKLSTKLLSAYLLRPYTFHLQTNTAVLLRTSTTEVSNVLYLCVVPLMTIAAECLVILALFGLIVVVNPVVALFSLGLGGVAAYAYHRLLRRRLRRIGADIQVSGARFMQSAQEGLGGIKEIKVLGREEYFISAFSANMRRYTDGSRKTNIINVLPRLMLEASFMLIFVGILVILTLMGRPADAIPLLAVYAAAAFRLIPGLSKVMNATSQLNLGKASLDLVIEDLSKGTSPAVTSCSGTDVGLKASLELRNLTYRYPGAGRNAIDDVSLTIKRGEMIGFMGSSGSGKTTLIDIILGLLVPTGGKVMVDGRDIQQDVGSWQSRIGYIPQTIYLTDDTLRRNIALGLGDTDIDELELSRALDGAQLRNFVTSLPLGLDTVVGERGARLSGGQRQRIGIARALYRNPEVLVLDEATSALDNETESEIVRTIRALQGQKTILVIAHRLTTVEGCERIYLLKDARLQFTGSLEDAMPLMAAEPEALEVVAGE